jgi:heme A synthase
VKRRRAERNRKLVALLLIVGGTVGMLIALWAELQFLEKQFSTYYRTAALMGLYAFIFGLCTWTGFDLWREKPHAFKWAQILLVAQIPSIAFPGFAYTFYTGFALYFPLSMLASFRFQLGAVITIDISPEIEGFVFSLNLVAIAALYLLGKSRMTI